MSETQTKVSDPFDEDLAEAYNAPQATGALTPVRPQQVKRDVFGALASAERPMAPRDLKKFLHNLEALSLMAREKFYYRWEAKDRNSASGKSVIMGPSIDLTMALMQIYGNCHVEVAIADQTPTHVVLAARFVDEENNTSVIRLFKQRLSQNLGMRDAERAADIVFQIGQSKATRNVIAAALRIYCDQAVKWAHDERFVRIQKNPEGARAWLLGKIKELEIPIQNVEYVIGRPAKSWLVPDMARLFGTLQSIMDTMTTVEDEFPPPGQGGEGLREKREAEASERQEKKDADLGGDAGYDPAADAGQQTTDQTTPTTQRRTRGPNRPRNTETPADAPTSAGQAGERGAERDGRPHREPDGQSASDLSPADPTSAADPKGTAEAAGAEDAAEERSPLTTSPAAPPADNPDDMIARYAERVDPKLKPNPQPPADDMEFE